MTDGGSAFPYQVVEESSGVTGAPIRTTVYPGMTLRDYFAGQALIGMMADQILHTETVAAYAYEVADAMIAARSKQT